ncbi:hypothetical protein GCM10022231_28850 [Gordonia caeni]|uniref:Uncharacterized protein n=1 Tax=Gordonia caeni TaxID=1007097 RepID=A0ABP7PKP6_9ACTN
MVGRSAAIVITTGVDCEIRGHDPRVVAPQWISGLDGQFVVAAQHLWIAREGDLPPAAAQHSARRVPLLEVAMFVVVAGSRRGCVREISAVTHVSEEHLHPPLGPSPHHFTDQRIA